MIHIVDLHLRDGRTDSPSVRLLDGLWHLRRRCRQFSQPSFTVLRVLNTQTTYYYEQVGELASVLKTISTLIVALLTVDLFK